MLWCTAVCGVRASVQPYELRGDFYASNRDEVREMVKTDSGFAVSDREPAAAVCCLCG